MFKQKYMRAKYLIIAGLVVLLGLVIVQMLKLEDRIRRSKIIEIVRDDTQRQLLENITESQLIAIARNADYHFIADGDYFSVLKTHIVKDRSVNIWEDIFLKGVNMGVALPGKFPSEFTATYEQYLEWFIQIGQMNANTIRVYTILPPEFYRALAYYNLNYENRKLYMLHGVWAKEPPNDDYTNLSYTKEFLNEIKDAVDVVHGNAVIKPKRGHASGVYANDVSDYVIGWVLGREWEPQAVTKTNRKDTVGLSYGVFVDVLEPNTMEKWLAGVMEFTVRYETQKYKAQRPVSFVNWLPLDPMYHNSEYIESEDVKEFDNDLESVDMEKFSPTNIFKPGIFASYHVYPYYPDFIFLEEKYRQTKNRYGQYDNYLAYLIDLKENQQGMPMVIAEYGLPSSRGNSHYTPFGYHQGGYSEQEQADLSVLLTENIHQSRCAGAIYFAWIDEWFKNNWLVMEFEKPQERRIKWHNMENPEQNYGIIALESRKIEINGSPDDWNRNLNKPFIDVDYDPAYLYLSAFMPEIDFKKNNLYIAIDTYDKNRGSFRLPFTDKKLRRGVEFLVEIKDSNNANVLVDKHYDIFTNRVKGIVPGYRSVKNHDGVFVEQFLLANRSRVDILGDTFPETLHNRGKLLFGKSNNPKTSNADFYYTDDGFLEMRLTWQILNVTDPSTMSVLDGNPKTGSIDVAETDGFVFLFFVTDKSDKIVNVYPNNRTYRFSWDKWDEPEYQSRKKPVYYALAELFREIEPLEDVAADEAPQDHNFYLCNYYRGRDAAVTFAFEGRCFSQYANAAPVFFKYRLNATFSKVEHLMTTSGAAQYRKMLAGEFLDLQKGGHEIRPYNDWTFDTQDGERISAMPYKQSYTFHRIRHDDNPSLRSIDTILKEGKDSWIIFLMRHIYEPQTREYNNLLHLAGRDAHNISPAYLDKLVRLSRNTGYWVAPFSKVADYLHVYENSSINTDKYQNRFFITLENDLDHHYDNTVVTIKYEGPANLLRVSGSASDGVFRVRGGKLFIDMSPNREVIVEIIE